MDASSRILVFGEGISFAHVSRAFMIAQTLQSRGATVRFVSSPRYAEWATQRGLDARPAYTPDAEKVYSRLRAMRAMYTRREIEQSVRADLAEIEAFQPTVLVGDCRNSLRISSELSNIPYVAISNANCTPWFAGTINAPAALPLNRIVGKPRVDRYVMPWLGGPIQSLACRAMNQPFAQAQRTFGATRPCRDFRVMFTSDDLHLLADLPQFQPTKNRPAHAQYIGPLFWGDDTEHKSATEQLLDQIDPAKPLVYLSMGSSGLHALLESTAPVLARLPYQFVVTTAGAAAFSQPADNIHALPFASAPQVLTRAAAVVCHGGNGTVYQALSHAVPVIAIPSFFDQEIQADQLTHHQLGLRLEPGEAADQLATALDTVIAQPTYRDRLPEWRSWMQQWNAESNAADAIEQFIAPASPATPTATTSVPLTSA
ncbi:glycosyltransferase [Phycisphaerales bacterium AB-hyl4]|uniref:Glycosyltransferase n=1 Tax=Natronomicrosphaera hydrolytica TaxID=3242702 RepID=A0ABV4U1P6_9BACT